MSEKQNKTMSTSNKDDDWQSSKDTLQSKAAYMLQRGRMSDVHFIVGKDASKQKISAHKLILSMSSCVFERMFSSALPIPDEILLPDVTTEALHAMLKFIYTDKVDVTSEIVMDTIYAAKKYGLTKLERSCEDFVMKNVTSENACSLLSQAKFFDERRLMKLCLEKIDRNPATSFASGGFLELDLDLLCSIFARSSLEMAEKDVFKAAIRWSRAECTRKKLTVNPTNVREVLGKALSLIRFPIMSQAEFADGPAKSGVLTKDECVDIFLYLAASTKPKIKFPISRRESGLLEVNRFPEKTTGQWEIRKRSYTERICEEIRFSANRHIALKGAVILTKGDFWTTVHDGSLKISNSSGVVIQNHNIPFGPRLTSPTTEVVMLEKAVEITANVEYTVTTKFSGYGSYFVGVRGNAQVVVKDNDADVIFNFSSPASRNSTWRSADYYPSSINEGFLWALYFIPLD